jgi:hypothetical protein
LKQANGNKSWTYRDLKKNSMFGQRFRAFFEIVSGALLERFVFDELGKTFAPADVPFREFLGTLPDRTLLWYTAQ